MATTVTKTGEITYLSFPIEKTETTPDGDVYVYGKATDGSVDSDEQIVDPEFSAKAIQEWLSTGANVRVQHNPQRDPAGVGVEVHSGPDGETWVKSLVIEPVAKRLVEKGALRAYSVGIARPKIVRDAVARGGRIVDGEICEISLVDRPANKNCGIQLVKSDESGHAEFVGKMFGNSELLTKGRGNVSVDLPSDVSVSFSPADLAKLLAHRQVAEEREAELAVKRDVRPEVGGGVDVDKLPDSDFAGRDRSFPIHTPGDVQDAASSIGRAGSDNYSSDKLKENIVSIARRKGPEFVEQLPESWKDDSDSSKSEKGKKGKKPFPGAAPAFGESKDDEAKPDATKGGDECDDMDDEEDDESMADKNEEPESVKGDDKVMCGSCGANLHAKHNFCPECGKSTKGSLPLDKNHKFTCLGCGNSLDKGEKFCGHCGKKNPGHLPEADNEIEANKAESLPDEDVTVKGKRPTPGDSAGEDSVKPVPAHREPDGPDVERFEMDAGLDDGDEGAEMKAATRIKSAGAPRDLGSVHDLLCPAFHPDHADKAHPGVSLTSLDLVPWQQKAMDAATGATLQEAVLATQLWQHAETVKSADPWDLTELRHDAFKSFQDANPGPGTFPKPTELSPTKFNRPYLSAGHASPSTGHEGPTTHPVPTEHMDAASHDRSYLTTGHAANSPSNKGDSSVIAAPVPTGAPSRVYYSNARREAAREAMSAIHDHIAQTFPDLCSMSGPGTDGQAPVGDRPVPAPAQTKSESDESDEPKKVKKSKKNKGDVITKAAGGAGLVEAVNELMVITKGLRAELESERERTAKLQETLNAMADMPDPSTAPWRGVAQAPMAAKSSGVPAGAQSVADAAAQTQLLMMRNLEEQFRTSPDPAQREAAWNSLLKMRGIQ